MRRKWNIERGKRGFAVLVDPDKQDETGLARLADLFSDYPPDSVLVGGSLLYSPIGETVSFLKMNTEVPVYLFPGDVSQVSQEADGILLISLISGRNPDYLIGQHVIAAPQLRRSGMDVISTGYMLIENGHSTSVEYISNTMPIPFGKTDLAVATAMAGEMLGMKAIYLEAGSGAAKPVGIDMIEAIRKAIDLPIIVGGGIRNAEDAVKAYDAGADIIVIGSRIEEDPEQIKEFSRLKG